jgi:O-antigen/teichoic acid export membrane protein
MASSALVSRAIVQAQTWSLRVVRSSRAPVTNVSIRCATLALRFLLVPLLLYWKEPHDAGVFALYMTTITLGASNLGLDLYTAVSRDLLRNVEASESNIKCFGGLVIALGTLSAAPTAAAIYLITGDVALTVIAFFHLPLELICHELGRLLIPMGHPLLASVVLFLRTASWVPVFSLAVFLEVWPVSAGALASGWLSGTVLGLITGLWSIRHRLHRPAVASAFAWGVRALKQNRGILGSSLLMRLLMGVDRYVAAFLLGDNYVAGYTAQTMAAMSVNTFVEASSSAFHYPRLIIALGSGETSAVVARLSAFERSNAFWVVISTGMVALAVLLLLAVAGSPLLPYGQSTFWIVLPAVSLYSLSLPRHYLIYGAVQDYMLLRIGAIGALTFVISVACLAWVAPEMAVPLSFSASLCMIAGSRYIFSAKLLRDA